MWRWLVVGCVGLGLGCSTRTETGYKPRRLGDSETVQRGYYATPFSPEARQAEAERAAGDSNLRRSPDWRPGMAP